MSTIRKLSRYFQRYITITGFTGETYTYVARSRDKKNPEKYPILDCQLHREKCKPGSWLYIAVEGNSDLNNLDNAQKLYVGSQTQDRMFRGDGLKGKNFHHQEMRKGSGQNNLEEYLQKGRTVEIYIISKGVLERGAAEAPELKHIAQILADDSLKKYANHPAYWYEQIILSEEKRSWSWNEKGADSKAQEVIRRWYSST
jgi:hypothetical protein